MIKNKDHISILVNKKTKRLQYIFDFVIEDVCGLDYSLTTDIGYCTNKDGFFLNYSNHQAANIGFKIKPDRLLYEDGIYMDIESKICDLFSEIFFHLTRYEEYLPFKADKYNRFPANQSYLFKTNQLLKPRTDELIQDFQQQLTRHYPTITLKPKVFTFLPTIDIDRMYEFKYKSLIRNAAGFTKNLLNGQLSVAKRRLFTQFNLVHDSSDMSQYEDFPKIENLHSFILNAQSHIHDNSLSSSHQAFNKQIKFFDRHTKIGMHPSYASNTCKTELVREKSNLEEFTIKPIIRSRQHYIKLSFPKTYQDLIDLNISEDYSMGYADYLGFRAGTAKSFYWYDLENERTTQLRIYPFLFMDVTLKDYLKLTPNEAKNQILNLKSEVKTYGGNFSFIVHNSSLSYREEWTDWSDLFWSILLQKLR